MDAYVGRECGASLEALSRLRCQLHLLVPALTVGEGHPHMTSLLATLRTTAASVEGVLAVAEPEALASIRAGLEHAVAGEHNESRSELLAAYHRLSLLLHEDGPRRLEAAEEPIAPYRPHT